VRRFVFISPILTRRRRILPESLKCNEEILSRKRNFFGHHDACSVLITKGHEEESYNLARIKIYRFSDLAKARLKLLTD